MRSSETTRQASKTEMKLSNEWIVGFVDGEGCFEIGIQRNPRTQCGYQVIPEFRVVLHERDVQLLHSMKKHLGCGEVRRKHEERWELTVRKLDQLEGICNFFDQNKLKTKKSLDFIKFRTVLHMMGKGEHLTQQGIKRIAKIASQMNTGKRNERSEIGILDEDIVHTASKDVDQV